MSVTEMPQNRFKTQRREDEFVQNLMEIRKVTGKLVDEDLDEEIHNKAY
jgi:hypothetical protein